MIEKLAGAGAAAAAAAPRAGEDPARVRDADSQFEALLLGQLLKSMRDSSGGWLGTGDDEAGASMLEIAQEHLARVLAAQGGLGLAGMVVKGLEQKPGGSSNP